MPMRNDPFAKLGALDQQLFRKPAPAPASSPVPASSEEQKRRQEADTEAPHQGTLEPRNQPSKESRNLGRSQASKLPRKEAWTEQKGSQSLALDLNQRPDRQNTYAFTSDELEGLEDLKILIRRRYDLNITKNDLIRCAVHLLLEEYYGQQDESTVLDRLRKKKER